MSRPLLVAWCLLSCAVAGCRHPEPPGPLQPPPGEVWLSPERVRDAKIEIAPVSEQNIDDTILMSGKVTFDDQRVAHVLSPVTGRVMHVDAQLGQKVKKGQALAVLQSPDISAASSDLSKASADLIAAEHDFNRKKELYAVHAASQADYEASEDNYRKAKAEHDRALMKAKLFHSSGSGVTQGYTLSAPIDGEVLTRNLNPGIEVQGLYGGNAAQELFTIGELDLVWVLADVYEIDLARVKVGAKAVVKVVSSPGKAFEGKVDWVSAVLDPVSRTAKVRCIFANPDRLLRPEMYATVLVSVEEKRAVAVPRSAVLRLGDQTVVFTETGQTAEGKLKFERVPVSVDEGESGDWLPVSHGVEAGMKIVTSGAILLSGML